MPKRLKRYYGKGHLHFLTFSCYRRLSLLGTERARNLFVEELAKVRSEYDFRLIGYVVMPNHVHLLISEPSKGTPSTVLQMLKQRVSRKLRKRTTRTPDPPSKPEGGAPSDLVRPARSGQLRLAFGEDGEQGRAFWQARFYDFNVYSEGKRKEKLNYMHANPVIRRLVGHPKDWPWSSWSFYAKRQTGLIGIDAVDR